MEEDEKKRDSSMRKAGGRNRPARTCDRERDVEDGRSINILHPRGECLATRRKGTRFRVEKRSNGKHCSKNHNPFPFLLLFLEATCYMHPRFYYSALI